MKLPTKSAYAVPAYDRVRGALVREKHKRKRNTSFFVVNFARDCGGM